MGFEKKIRKELDKHERLWEGAAILPSVTKFGRQADKRIAKLKAREEVQRTLTAEYKRAAFELEADNQRLREAAVEADRKARAVGRARITADLRAIMEASEL